MQLSAQRAILLAVIVVGLMLAPIPDYGPVHGALFDLLHAPLFALLAWAAFHGLRPRLPRTDIAAWLLVVGVVFAIGVAVELGQSFTGRNASLQDIAADGLGATAAMVWACRSARSSRAYQTGYALLTAALFCAAAARPAIVLAVAASECLHGYTQISSSPEGRITTGDDA